MASQNGNDVEPRFTLQNGRLSVTITAGDETVFQQQVGEDEFRARLLLTYSDFLTLLRLSLPEWMERASYRHLYDDGNSFRTMLYRVRLEMEPSSPLAEGQKPMVEVVFKNYTDTQLAGGKKRQVEFSAEVFTLEALRYLKGQPLALWRAPDSQFPAEFAATWQRVRETFSGTLGPQGSRRFGHLPKVG